MVQIYDNLNMNVTLFEHKDDIDYLNIFFYISCWCYLQFNLVLNTKSGLCQLPKKFSHDIRCI